MAQKVRNQVTKLVLIQIRENGKPWKEIRKVKITSFMIRKYTSICKFLRDHAIGGSTHLLGPQYGHRAPSDLPSLLFLRISTKK